MCCSDILYVDKISLVINQNSGSITNRYKVERRILLNLGDLGTTLRSNLANLDVQTFTVYLSDVTVWRVPLTGLTRWGNIEESSE